jgi:hypothetical protein
MKHVFILSIFLILIFAASAPGQTPAPQSTPASVSAEAQKTIDANTPEALPQEPVAKKERSDAEDENIKGKVKTVVSESETVGRANSRNISSLDDYDKRGNRLKHVYFDWADNPSQITVYGYIDGARVSRDKSIRHPYDPPAPMAPARPPNAPPDPPRDTRYSIKYEVKYANGRMSERLTYGNAGNLWTRAVYSWKDKNQVEVLVYTSKGDLSQKWTRTYDKDGNEIEAFTPDLIPGKPYGNKRYVMKYEAYDKAGNWTRKTLVINKVSDDGTEIETGTYITYRTITYYE